MRSYRPRMCFPERLALVAALMLVFVSVEAISSVGKVQYLIRAGQGIGPVQLHMSREQVVAAFGSPAQRDGDAWTYVSPAYLRVTFRDATVVQITTWDSRAVTGGGLRIGTTREVVARELGRNMRTIQASPGYWMSNDEMGLAVYIQTNAAAAFAVMPQRTRLPPQTSSQPTPAPAKPQSPPTASSGPHVVIDNLVHKVTGTVQVAGILKNVSNLPRLQVAIVVSGTTFRGTTSARREVAAAHLEPGEQAQFAVDVGKDLWQSYVVRVDSYSPKQSGDVTDVKSGVIDRGVYFRWAGEDMTRNGHASAYGLPTRQGPRVWENVLVVTGGASLPRYAQLIGVGVRVRYSLAGRFGRRITEDREMEIVLGPPSWRAEFPFTYGDHFDIFAYTTVTKVLWQLNF